MSKIDSLPLGQMQREIRVILDGSWYHYNCWSLAATLAAIEGQDMAVIETPCTTVFDNDYVEKGFKVTVQSGKTVLCLNQLLEDGELRPAQNAEKMLLSGVFKIDVPQLKGDE